MGDRRRQSRPKHLQESRGPSNPLPPTPTPSSGAFSQPGPAPHALAARVRKVFTQSLFSQSIPMNPNFFFVYSNVSINSNVPRTHARTHTTIKLAVREVEGKSPLTLLSWVGIQLAVEKQVNNSFALQPFRTISTKNGRKKVC